VSDGRETEAPRKAPRILVGGVHLAALWALAVIQPLLSLLGSNPDFFVARDNTGGQIVLFAVLVMIVPPLVATAVEAVVNLVSPAARWVLHLLLVALLMATLVLQFLKQLTDGPAILMIIAAVVAGILLARAYRRPGFVRSLTDILAPAPVIILLVFLFFSDASELATGSQEVEAIATRIDDPAPVVMIVYDEFPEGSLLTSDGELNARRFPNFAELGSRSDWYRNTVTNASYTAIAVPALLTGIAPDRDRLPTAADHPQNIFTLLGDSYEVHATEPITQLCPPAVCGEPADRVGTVDALTALFDDLKYVSAHLALPESMGDSLPDISQSFAGFGGDAPASDRERASRFVQDRLGENGSSLDGEGDVNEFLAAMTPGAERTFDFVHVTEPHYPWTHYPDGKSYTSTTEDYRAWITDTDWLAGPYLTDRASQAHLLEVGFADHLLGRVISRLKRDGRWDESLVVVAADHGGAMTRDSNRREAEPGTIGEIATVPLFIKAPGQRTGRTIDRPNCLTEVLFEMAGRIGAEVPWEPAACDRDEVAIDNGSGPLVRAGMDQVLAGRARYVDRLTGLFGDGGWPPVMRLGPNQDLIGRQAGTLATGTGEASARPETAGPDGVTYRPRAAFNPVLRQRGSLDGVDAGTPLAVAVNGRIAAVGESYAEGSRTLYSILLPQSSLKPGPNRIALYATERRGAGAALTELWPKASD
jgi:hypothetical protein